MRLARTREWTKYLPDGFTIYHRLVTFFGRVQDFSVVLMKNGQCISRYDVAHGFAHRDVLGRKSASPLFKLDYPLLTLEEVFKQADEDLSTNYVKYFAYYEQN